MNKRTAGKTGRRTIERNVL